MITSLSNVFAEESISVELYANESKLIIQNNFISESTKRDIIIGNVLKQLYLDENKAESIIFQDMTVEKSRLADKLRINANIVNCETSVSVLYELIIPTTNQTEIINSIVNKELVDKQTLEDSFIMNIDSINNVSIRVKVDEEQTKSQVMLCDSRMSFRFNTQEKNEILSLLENNT
ncbi:MAG: hypothetical protein R3321_13870, partial [Nitrososphaeraceae archaeon]|nr:hypothetical protein [Nitrososphaeraceae archaeon]